MTTSDWDQMVDWWDEKLGDEGDLWHRALIDPPVIQLAGVVKGLLRDPGSPRFPYIASSKPGRSFEWASSQTR